MAGGSHFHENSSHNHLFETMKKILIIIAIGLGTIFLLLALTIAGLCLHYRHQTQKVRTSLAHEVTRYAEALATTQSNVVIQCSDGRWLGRVKFLDGDWIAIAHHSRHTQNKSGLVSDITVVLMSDRTLWDTQMHYCRESMFWDLLLCGWVQNSGERTFTNRADFLTNQFETPLLKMNKDFKPTTEPYSK